MASQQDIKRRIRSVGNTRKVTKALELVASARLRRAEERIVQMRDYADRMQELMVGTARAAASFRNLTLLQRREVQRVALLVVSGDRGLAGPFNGQVLRRAFELERQERAQGHEVLWTIVGRKGASTLRFRRYKVTANAILPGWIATDMTAARVDDPKFAGAVLPRIPLRRWGDGADFAGIATYLASDASAYHTGDSFVIDGAYTIF